MRLGRFPCQEEALRDAIAAQNKAGKASGFNRRAWFALIGTAACSGALGYWARPAWTQGEEKAIDPRTLWARRMASEETPIEVLLENADGFVRQLMARAYEDPVVWSGVARICVALENDPRAIPAGARQGIARMIADTIPVTNPPSELRMSRFLPMLHRLGK